MQKRNISCHAEPIALEVRINYGSVRVDSPLL